LSSEHHVRDFFERYRTAFTQYDAAAIADLFAYPAHVTSDTGEVVLTPLPSPALWVEQLQRLLANYRAIGVAAARLSRLEVTDLSPRLCQAVVHWELTDERGRPLYDFQAAYTLAELGGALRISSIAHNEVPRYRTYLARLRAQRPGAGDGPEYRAG
jgi:nitrate reductase assembly molybdenum cofactor insertion protein NarJ